MGRFERSRASTRQLETFNLWVRIPYLRRYNYKKGEEEGTQILRLSS